MPHTLLLADDSVAIQRVIELTFAEEDVQVVAVGDGEQAIARMEASPPDIVLADIGMPGKNGYDVAQYVRDSPRLAHIPVVLLTGAFEPIDQARAAASGCEGVLAKPFEPHLVIDRVRELLAKGARATTADSSRDLSGVDAESASTGDARPSPSAGASAPKSPAELDNYFNELDAALANLTVAEGRPAEESTPASTPEPDTMGAAEEPISTPPADDWFGAFNATSESPTLDHSGVTPPSAPEESSHTLSYGSPEAEFDGPRESTETIPPSTAAPAISDEMLDRIAQRVLAQLSDRIVRETVTGLVSEIAERLVREEIERIKAAAK